MYFGCIQDTLSSRAALGLPAVQPLGRVRRASKGILHTSILDASSSSESPHITEGKNAYRGVTGNFNV